MSIENGKKTRKTTRAAKKHSRRPGLFLHDLFAEKLEQHVDTWRRVADLVVRQLEAKGAMVTPRQRRQIEKHVRAGSKGLLKLSPPNWWKDDRKVRVRLTKRDIQPILDDADKLMARLPKIVPAVVHDLAPKVLSDLRGGYLADYRNDERQFRAIATDIGQVWRKPFESLALLVEVVCRMPATVDAYHAHTKGNEPYLVHAIARLHLRGIHIAREITLLLRSGYADGAMARWRTLHEVAVVICFLAMHGESCANRYLAHDAVDRYRAASRYQEFSKRLGFKPLTRRQFAAVQTKRDAALRMYGKPFDGEYGWASGFVGNQLMPKFRDIEQAVGLDHLRPFYKLASDNVHAGVRGALWKLGAVEPGKLVTSPSPAGLTDPAQNTALTLAVIAAHVTRICPTVDAMVCALMARDLASEVADRFIAVDDSIEIVPLYG